MKTSLDLDLDDPASFSCFFDSSAYRHAVFLRSSQQKSSGAHSSSNIASGDLPRVHALNVPQDQVRGRALAGPLPARFRDAGREGECGKRDGALALELEMRRSL